MPADPQGIAKALDSRTSQAIMDKDYVRPAQVQTYLPLLGQVGKVLGSTKPENAHGVGGGLPTETRKQLQALFPANTPKSHIWVKGLVATWVAVHNPPKS